MLIPKHKELERIWGEVPVDYYFRQNLLQRLWHDRKWSVFKRLILSSINSPKKILEIGCASGHMTNLLAQLFPNSHIVGIDIYKPAVNEARKRFPEIEFIEADAHNLPFPKTKFDLIVSSETIEHVVDPAKMLHEITRVLKPFGIALIEMDSGSKLFRGVWWVWTHFGKGKVWQDAHLHPFTARQLEALITQNGLNVKNKSFSHLGMAVSFLISPKTAKNKRKRTVS